MARTYILEAFFLVSRSRVVFLWRFVCFVLFRFVFHVFAFIEAAALCSNFLRYACAPAASCSYLTTVCVLFCFVSLEMSFFSRTLVPFIVVFSPYEEYVVRFSLPDGDFLRCDHGLDFFISAYHVRIQSINQSLCSSGSPFCAHHASLPVRYTLLAS